MSYLSEIIGTPFIGNKMSNFYFVVELNFTVNSITKKEGCVITLDVLV